MPLLVFFSHHKINLYEATIKRNWEKMYKEIICHLTTDNLLTQYFSNFTIHVDLLETKLKGRSDSEGGGWGWRFCMSASVSQVRLPSLVPDPHLNSKDVSATTPDPCSDPTDF
jgi:hypothetical protein